MSSITATGIGSGLDINSIISQLMATERRPLEALETKKQGYDAELSAYGKLSNAISSFQSAMDNLNELSKFKIYSPTSSDENVFTATASSDAAAGSYSINTSAVAHNHKLASTAIADASTVVGTGTLAISVGSSSFSLTIDSSSNTLGGIRDAINNASDNTGVTATIINADGGSYLVLTADDSGTANSLSVTVTGDGDGSDTDTSGLSQLVYVAGTTENMTEIDAAQDALFTVDGNFTVTSSSNTIDTAIQGITLELKTEDSATLTVERDNEAVKESVQEFVDAYNNLDSVMEELGSGDLQGESVLLSIESQLRSVFNSAATGLSGNYSYLAEVGVTFQKDGTLALDASTLDSALIADFDGVAQLFGDSSQGYAVQLKGITDSLLSTTGVLKVRQDGINDRIDNLEDRKVRLERRLEIVQKRYQDQFTALDTLLGNLQATSDYLTNQLSALTSSSG
jgi:flagellar hook-associated protein 2